MLSTARFRALLEDGEFLRNLGLCAIDEAHLVNTWGKDFRPLYLSISTLRARLPTRIVFLAMTATLEAKSGRHEVQRILGFTPDQFHDEKQPID